MMAVHARGVVVAGIGLATTGLLLLAGCSQTADRTIDRPSDHAPTTPATVQMDKEASGKRPELSPATPGTDTMSTSEPKLNPGNTPDKTRRVDDSGQNEVDRNGASLTSFDQGTSEADISITQAARKSLTSDSSLSINAQNLKIITNGGVVVLRGPVANRVEANAVLDHVRTINGVTRIENQIAVP